MATQNSLQPSPFPPAHAILNPQPPVVIQPSPDGGQGLYTTRPIPAFTAIFTDPPLLSIHPTDDLPQLYTNFLALSSSQRKAYLSLHQEPDPPRDEVVSTKLRLRGVEEHQLTEMVHVAAVFQANAFTLTDDDGVKGRAVFGRVARMNHACAPNVQAVNYPGQELGEMIVFAIRDLVKGEELRVTYFNILMAREQRLERTLEWGFQCRCVVCCDEGWETEERRTRVREWLGRQAASLGGCTSAERVGKLVEEGREVLKMVERDESGLIVAAADVCDGIAMLLAEMLVLQGKDGKNERGEVFEMLEHAAVADARVTGPESPTTLKRLTKVTAFAAMRGDEKTAKMVTDNGRYIVRFVGG